MHGPMKVTCEDLITKRWKPEVTHVRIFRKTSNL